MNVSTINKTLLIVLFFTTPLVALMAGITTKCSPAEGGTISSLGGYEYKAIPNSGYVFSHWNMSSPLVEHSPSSNPYDFYSFLMTYGGGDFTLTAYFEKTIDPTWQILYTSSDGNVVTPYKTDGFGANIVSNEYKDGQGIITFDGPVTQVGDSAFYECTSLTSITIPNSVESIGNRAFYYCSSLTSITIPNSVTSIGGSTFYNCFSLTSVTIPNSVTSIGSSAFMGCSSLTSITIPNSVTSIGSYAFASCYSLTSVTIPNSVTSIVYGTFWYCKSLTSITIPNSVTSIGGTAFYGCSSLTSITIPNSVTSIGERAFSSCSSLTTINVDTNNPNYSSVDGVLFNKDQTTLIQYPIGNTRSEYTIPNSVTSIGEYAFYFCKSLTSVTIPESVTSIGEEAFLYCDALTSITCKATTPPTLGEDAFDSKLKTAYIPCGTKSAYEASDWASYSITSFVEEGCIDPTWQILYTSSDGNVVTPYVSNFGANIVSNEYKDGQGIITFDGPVTSIGDTAFYRCYSLASITIPNSVESIGKKAFQICYNLTSVTIGSGVTSIGYWAFGQCSDLISISIPNSVKNIGEGAFAHCKSLASVTIPNSVTSIGENAFFVCEALTSISIPKSVTSIGKCAFSDCDVLTSMVVESGNTTYDSREGCNAIIETATNVLIAGCKSSIIPNSVTSIGECAFGYCRSLTSITIPNSVTSIGFWAFGCCSLLTSVTIPEGVISIGGSAFSECSSLTSITCEATTPPTLGKDVFNNIDNTIPVYVPCGSISAYKADASWNYFKNFQSSEQFAMAVHSNNDTWGQVSITQPTIPYVGFTAIADNSSIRMVYGGTLVGCIPNLQYSYDGQSWKKLEEGTNYNVEKGQTIYMRGHNPDGVSIRFDGYSYFDMKGSFEGSGDIMTLVDSTGATTTAPDYCFYRLFRNCTSLTKAPRLTATTVNYQAYVSMFSGCTNLQHIEVDFTAWSSSATESWVSSVAPTGTFVKPTALSTSYGSSNIPSGWTVMDKEENDGSTSNVTSGTYECETTLILTATPNDCYQFTKWSDGNTDNPRTVVVNEDATYTAEFMPIPYTITVESADESQGSVQVEIN